MLHIIKLCADNLRIISDQHGAKLKATHAHELVASYCGYKSKAALLADIQHPLSNLHQASIITLAPIALINDRRAGLKDLPPDLPDTDILRKCFYDSLFSEERLMGKFWLNLEALAQTLANEHLSHDMRKIYRKPSGEGITLERSDDYMQFIVKRFYQVPTERPFSDGEIYVHEANITTVIHLQRLSGHIGYAKPEVSTKVTSSDDFDPYYHRVLSRL